MRQRHTLALLTALVAVAALSPRSARAQNTARACFILCAPTLKVEPTLTIENLFARHRVQDVATGEVVQVDRVSQFELIVALDIPTTIPRLGLTFESIWKPFAATSTNPFTGATAEDLGRSEIRDNAVELEFELNLYLLEGEATGGWIGAHFDVVDKFSPAKRPGDGSVYTHKLNFELDVALAPFNFLESGWLRGFEVETSFDYVATGLPRAGDVLGGERYLDDASPWSLSLVLVFPIAPLGS